MASWYYLVSQLPALSDSTTRLPITEAYFMELCSRFLDAKSLHVLEQLSLEPPLAVCKTGSALVDAWYDWERKLRLALAQIRAVRMKKELPGNEAAVLQRESIPPDILQTARTACGYESPLEAEQFLNAARMAALDAMTPSDMFSTDALFAYALKIKLAERTGKFSTEEGKSSYRKIYDQILGETA